MTRIEGSETIDESAVDPETMGSGFFRGPVFLHPDLKFQYRFPDGWSTWNGGDAVIGLSAAQDAIIKLRLAAGTPLEAAETFFGQPELAAERIAGVAINGLPATTGEFSADTGLGTVRGIATFIAHGGATYEVMASTISNEFDSYVTAVKQSITTFDHLNGLGVEAPRSGASHPNDAQGPSWFPHRVVLPSQASIQPQVDSPQPGPAGRVRQADGMPSGCPRPVQS